jgi:tetratricopeptide (TPR) repeat protein
MRRARHLSVVELVDRLQADARLRQRAAALAGAFVFFAAALTAVGLGQVVLMVVGVAALAGLLLWAARHVSQDRLQQALRAARSEQARQPAAILLGGALTSAGTQSMSVVRRSWAIASTAVARMKRRWSRRETQAVGGGVLPPAADELYGWPYAGSNDVALPPRPVETSDEEERRRAFELNARGTHLRRAGTPAAAAALHLEALEILRSLDDRRAQALSLNSLALALAATGETDAAVERFEQSLSILRERPDDPGQGEVIANLGFTLLRHGGDERARELLGEALEKLPPESRAAHKVEAQLRRAS